MGLGSSAAGEALQQRDAWLVEVVMAPRMKRSDRVSRGRALRRRLPRSSHASWPTLRNRPDPLALLEQSHDARLSELEALRWGRMGVSPFTFLRGSAMVMAWDVAHLPHGDVYVQACGDAHLGNFGTFATPERHLIFDLRDFDETLPAPWEWDVKRLAASIVVSGREQGITDSCASDAVLACVRQYRETMQESLELSHQEIWYRRVDAEALTTGRSKQSRRFGKRWVSKARKRTSLREMEKLTEIVDGHRHIKEARPLIFPVEPGHMHDVIVGILDRYAASLSPDRRALFDRYRLIDLAYRVVGVGSVGTRCMIALFAGDDDDDPLFLQMKEATRSVLEPFAGECPSEPGRARRSGPAHHPGGERHLSRLEALPRPRLLRAAVEGHEGHHRLREADAGGARRIRHAVRSHARAGPRAERRLLPDCRVSRQERCLRCGHAQFCARVRRAGRARSRGSGKGGPRGAHPDRPAPRFCLTTTSSAWWARGRAIAPRDPRHDEYAKSVAKPHLPRNSQS
jgi:uncharacterized protein (DUF2252 family)